VSCPEISLHKSVNPDGGAAAYPGRDGMFCGDSWTDADGSWSWDSDSNLWVGQTSGAGDWHSGSSFTNNESLITQWEPNFFGNIQENYLKSNDDDDFFKSSLKLVGNVGYGILDDAYVYGTRNFSKSSTAMHLNRDGADPKEVLNSGMNTITTFMPTPLKAGLVPKFNVATFGSTFKGTFLTKLTPATRGTVITYSNKLITQLHTKNFISVSKSVAKKIEKE
jgi:hypothetical protein